MRKCENEGCKKNVKVKKVGRPRRFCSDRCQFADWNRKHPSKRVYMDKVV